MNHLKKLLALSLSALLLTVCAGAAQYTDAADIKHIQAVSILSELELLQGDDQGAFLPAATLARGEMMKLVVLLMNSGLDPKFGGPSTNSSYSDTAGHWAANYIEYGTALGIAAGRGDGTFDPDGLVTYTEAAKLLLIAPGYDAKVEKMTGNSEWAVYTGVLAHTLGLFEGIDGVDPAGAITRDDAAQMVLNVLSVERVSYNFTHASQDPESPVIGKSVGRGTTLLQAKFNLDLKDGVLVPNTP